jgi:UDP-N-acetylmuramoyl-L-alanyl-D-glutamate--2,6-diaminopimelate ligase
MEATAMTPALCTADQRLSAILPHARRIGSRDVSLASCCSDSGQIRPGDIYVALLHADGDGHFDVDRAIERGAAAVVAERLLPVRIPQYLVEDSREAYGQLCQAVVGAPSRRLCTVGVTGTHGKTSVAVLVAAVLEAAGHPTGRATSLGWTPGRGAGRTFARWTPPLMARHLAEMEGQGCEAAVLEVSSRALAERRLAGVELDIAVITNIRRGPLDLHGTPENYRRAKLRLLKHLKSTGLAVLNVDDPVTRQFADEVSCPVLLTGIDGPGEITATLVERVPSEQTFLLTAGSDTTAVRTRIIGDYHIRNCLQAAAVGLSLGVDLPTVIRGLEMVEQLPGRMERLECGQPFSVFVDGSQTPDRLAVALKTLRSACRGRVICVYGPDAGAPEELRPLFGRVAERCADVNVLTSNNPAMQAHTRVSDAVLDGYQRPAKAWVIPDRRRAIQFALSQAAPGDVVLIAGKGDRAGQDLGRHIEEFDDREETRAWLYRDPDDCDDSTDKPVILRMY